MWLDTFVYPSSVSGHLGYFHYVVIMNPATVNMRPQVFLWTCVFILHGWTPRSGVAGSRGSALKLRLVQPPPLPLLNKVDVLCQSQNRVGISSTAISSRVFL